MSIALLSIIAKFPREQKRFATVGGVGFLVDASVLLVAIELFGGGLYSSRLLSFSCAVSVTWYMNRFWTFGTAGNSRKKKEYLGYFIVQAVGAIVNFGVYALCIESSEFMRELPIIPLAIGAAVALFFNYFFSKRLVFIKG